MELDLCKSILTFSISLTARNLIIGSANWLYKLIRKKDKDPGTAYPPNSLYQLCCGLQQHMQDNGRPEVNFFTDASFNHFQDCLDAEMKRLTGMSIGSNIKEAQAFSEDEENKLWNLRLLGDSCLRVLSDTMVFLIGKNFFLQKEKRSTIT